MRDMAKTKIKIQFIEVGRQNFSETVTFVVPRKNYKFSPDDIAALAFREARKHLHSANVNAIYNSEKNEGTVYAGFHMVGKFRVVK